MITIHHLNNSRSHRVLWLLEELGQDYEVVHYTRDAKTMLAPASLRAVHPLGKSPVITDGGSVIAESGAIIEYLVERYGNGLSLKPPAGTPEAQRYTYWLHFAEGSAMPPLLMTLIVQKIPAMPMPFFARPVARAIASGMRQRMIDPQLKTQLKYMENELAEREWFAGPLFSAADVQMSFPLQAAAKRGGLNASDHPGLSDFLKRIADRPAYKRALERGGPLELLG